MDKQVQLKLNDKQVLFKPNVIKNHLTELKFTTKDSLLSHQLNLLINMIWMRMEHYITLEPKENTKLGKIHTQHNRFKHLQAI